MASPRRTAHAPLPQTASPLAGGSLTGGRFLLLLGGDGVIAARCRGSQVAALDAVRLGNEAGLAALRAAMAENSGWPVTALVDVGDLAFRQESIPAVGWFDRAKLIERRLEHLFPGIEARGALAGTEAHLFVALPAAPDWDRWRGWLQTLANPVAAVAVAPVELAGLARALARRSLKAERSGWLLLVCRHLSGGIRQVVVRGNEFVMTRLVAAAEADSDASAGIARELDATLSYLPRLGWSAAQGIDLIAVGMPELQGEAASAGGRFRHRAMLTVEQAAARLGVRLPRLPPAMDPDHADALSLGWLARRRRPLLDVQPRAWRQRERGGAALRATRQLLAAGLVAAIGFEAYAAYAMLQGREQVAVLSRQVAVLAGERDERLALVGSSGIDPLFTEAAMARVAAWQAAGGDALADFERLRAALPEAARLQKVSWSNLVAEPAGADAARPGAPRARARLEVEVLVPAGFSAEQALDWAGRLERRLAKALAPAKIVLARPPALLDLRQELVSDTAGAAGAAAGLAATAGLTVEFTP